MIMNRFKERAQDWYNRNWYNRKAILIVKAKVTITLKNGVLDPQGKAIEGALTALGFSGVENVRQGKVIEIELTETDKTQAEAKLIDMCKKLLANTVIENYHITFDT